MPCCGLDHSWRIPRRDFLSVAGAAAAGLTIRTSDLLGAAVAAQTASSPKTPALIHGAFLYPPTELLKKEGYYSWPGSGFDAEGHQRQYMDQLTGIGRRLGIELAMKEGPLFGAEQVGRFVAEAKERKTDGLLLVAFKKSEWETVGRIIEQTGLPTVAMATIGVLLMGHIRQLYSKPGVYVISSLDNFEAIEYGLNMIRTIHWMREARILSIGGTESKELTVDKLGTRVQVTPMQKLIDIYKMTESDPHAGELARTYRAEAKDKREPSDNDILEAARACVACKRLIENEKADALTMACLEGIQKKQIPPPCMGFMDLRDEGIVAACQNELDSTIALMLVQQLFGKPGFQHNPACDTEKNLYYGSHCTCPRRLNGAAGPAMPYVLRSHAEAGVGTVPQVLWPEGQEITLTHYIMGKEPWMPVYSGKVVRCLDMPPAGGCRTNLVATINEVPAIDVKTGGHQTIVAGNHAAQLRAFGQLAGIKMVT